MGPHVVSTTMKCPRCGAEGELFYIAGRSDADHTVRFSSSFTCSTCDLSQESAGPSLADRAREAFYDAEGRWSVAVRDLGPRQDEALLVLTEVRRDRPDRILRLIREGAPILVGTMAESECVEAALLAAGAEVESIEASS